MKQLKYKIGDIVRAKLSDGIIIGEIGLIRIPYENDAIEYRFKGCIHFMREDIIDLIK